MYVKEYFDKIANKWCKSWIFSSWNSYLKHFECIKRSTSHVCTLNSFIRFSGELYSHSKILMFNSEQMIFRQLCNSINAKIYLFIKGIKYLFRHRELFCSNLPIWQLCKNDKICHIFLFFIVTNVSVKKKKSYIFWNSYSSEQCNLDWHWSSES